MNEVVPYGWDAYTAVPPCEWGACSWCALGKHDNCAWVRLPVPAAGKDGPHTWILDKHGRVLHPGVSVYVVGTRERWTCTCHVHGHQGVGAQLDMFAGTT